MPDDVCESSAFWEFSAPDGPGPRGPVEPTPDTLGRPRIVIDGRNLAELLRPVYEAITEPRD